MLETGTVTKREGERESRQFIHWWQQPTSHGGGDKREEKEGGVRSAETDAETGGNFQDIRERATRKLTGPLDQPARKSHSTSMPTRAPTLSQSCFCFQSQAAPAGNVTRPWRGSFPDRYGTDRRVSESSVSTAASSRSLAVCSRKQAGKSPLLHN